MFTVSNVIPGSNEDIVKSVIQGVPQSNMAPRSKAILNSSGISDLNFFCTTQ
jgi:hypothetical protein